MSMEKSEAGPLGKRFIDCPPDLLRLLFSYVENKADLARVSLACRAFRIPAQKCLFSSFSYGWWNGPWPQNVAEPAYNESCRLHSFCRAIVQQPLLASFVRDIELAAVYHKEGQLIIYLHPDIRAAVENLEFLDAIPRRASSLLDENILFALLLGRLPNVSTICISGNKATPYLTMALYNILGSPSTHVPNLQKLELISWHSLNTSPSAFIDRRHDRESILSLNREILKKEESGLFEPLCLPFPTLYDRKAAAKSSPRSHLGFELNLSGVMITSSSIVKLRERDCLRSLRIEWSGPSCLRTGWHPMDLTLALGFQRRSLRRLTITHPNGIPEDAEHDRDHWQDIGMRNSFEPVSRTLRYFPQSGTYDAYRDRYGILRYPFDRYDGAQNEVVARSILNMSEFTALQHLAITAQILFDRPTSPGSLRKDTVLPIHYLFPKSLVSLSLFDIRDSHVLPLINFLSHFGHQYPKFLTLRITSPVKSEKLQLLWEMSPRFKKIVCLNINSQIWDPSTDPYIMPLAATNPHALRRRHVRDPSISRISKTHPLSASPPIHPSPALAWNPFRNASVTPRSSYSSPYNSKPTSTCDSNTAGSPFAMTSPGSASVTPTSHITAPVISDEDDYAYGFDSYVFIAWKQVPPSWSSYRTQTNEGDSVIAPRELKICWFYDPDQGCQCSHLENGMEHDIGVWPFELPLSKETSDDSVSSPLGLAKGKRKRTFDDGRDSDGDVTMASG